MGKGKHTTYTPREGAVKALKRLRAVATMHDLTPKELSDISGLPHKQLCVWLKPEKGMNGLKRKSEELINMFLDDIDTGKVSIRPPEHQPDLLDGVDADGAEGALGLSGEVIADAPLLAKRYTMLHYAHEELKAEHAAITESYDKCQPELRYLRDEVSRLKAVAAQQPMVFEDRDVAVLRRDLAECRALLAMYREQAVGGAK